MRGVLFALTVAILALPVAAHAQAVWVEVIGHAVAANEKDKPAARRRALADALISAGMAGGVSLKGHTVVDKGRVVRDITMMKAAGRVLRYDNLGEAWSGRTVQLRLRALVAPLEGPACGVRRQIILMAMSPEFRTSPNAPAWTDQLPAELYNDAIARMERHNSVTVDRVMGLGQAPASPHKNLSFDYNALTRGAVRTSIGDTQLRTLIDIDTERTGGRTDIVLRAKLQLVEGTGQITERTLSNTVPMPRTGTYSTMLNRKRSAMKQELTKGYTELLEGLLDVATCSPVAAHVARAGNQLQVNVGSRQGLTRNALAFTENPASDFEALEIVRLNGETATLRPVDPSTPISVFDGRLVRFVGAK